jgi:hypothetical protein
VLFYSEPPFQKLKDLNMQNCNVICCVVKVKVKGKVVPVLDLSTTP